MSGTFAARLLRWFEAHRRDLPWRARRSAWSTWVSEVMLQQTRVEVVSERFDGFLDEFPDPESFARASDGDLLRAWKGLGYYRRARLLRDGARAVVEQHGGAVPRALADLRSLPGVGDYTAGAISSIGFGDRAIALDGNVERVFARHIGYGGDVKKAAGRRELTQAVDQALPPRRAGDFNEAVMDLGATVCTPRSPRCDLCPVADDCAARASGRQSELPVLPPRKKAVEIAARLLVIPAESGFLGLRIAAGQINEGQIELPGPGVLVDHPGGPDALASLLDERFGAAGEVADSIGTARHGITHHRITLHVHPAQLRHRGSLQPYGRDAAWTTASRKALAIWDAAHAEA